MRKLIDSTCYRQKMLPRTAHSFKLSMSIFQAEWKPVTLHRQPQRRVDKRGFLFFQTLEVQGVLFSDHRRMSDSNHAYVGAQAACTVDR